MCRKIIVILFVLTIFSAYALTQDPIPISSITQLQMIGNDIGYPLDGNYVITQDIDASETATWDGGRGFDPIGEWSLVLPYYTYEIIPFEGHLDGQGHSISGLTVKQPEALGRYLGLFVAISAAGRVENLTLLDCDIEGVMWIGALTGQNAGIISACAATGTVQGTDAFFVDDRCQGGLVGENLASGVITQCHTSGLVHSNGGTVGVGGLVGVNSGAVHQCYSDAAVQAFANVGGLIGIHKAPANSSSTGEPLTPGTLSNSYASGTITGCGSVGGLVGVNGVEIEWVSAIVDCYSTGIVMAIPEDGQYGGEYAGGLVGKSWGSIQRCHAEGAVSGRTTVGGLVGDAGGSVGLFQCYAVGNITASDSIAGGLVGDLSCQVLQCFATGNVTAVNMVAGGLVGRGYGQIMDSYATGSVTSEWMIGGLLGDYAASFPHVLRCYATGAVISTSPSPPEEFIVGLAMTLSEEVVASFWDIETTGRTFSYGGTGLSTVAMQQRATFEGAGWDMLEIWDIDEGVSYPCLRWSPECTGTSMLSVSIDGPPVVTRELGSQHAFSAVVTGAIGTVSYQWYLDSVEKIAEPISGATSATYAITHLTYEDAGMYTCVVSDDLATRESLPVELRVVEQIPVSTITGLTVIALLITVVGVLLICSRRFTAISNA